MTFDDFAVLFGTKSDFIKKIPKDQRAAFKRAAMKLHRAGFDWYIEGGKDLLFGVRSVDNSRTLRRAGKVWDNFDVTINTGRKTIAVLSPEMESHLSSFGGTEDDDKTRMRFSIDQFDRLVSDKAFLSEFAELNEVTKATGLWPFKQCAQHEVMSIQEVFHGTTAKLAVVQRLSSDPKNRKALREGFTWHWPRLGLAPDLVVLHFKDGERREIWAGQYRETKPARDGDKRFELHVDEFKFIGVHLPTVLAEADLYGGEAGGGSRIYVRNEKLDAVERCSDAIPPEEERKALVQIRQHQAKFKESLVKDWGGRCAISRCAARSVLEGAHIIPFSVIRDYSKWNGLLLRADIHKLFDAYLLSVDPEGYVHIHRDVKDSLYTALKGTQVAFPDKKWRTKLIHAIGERHQGYLDRQGTMRRRTEG